MNYLWHRDFISEIDKKAYHVFAPFENDKSDVSIHPETTLYPMAARF
jgi:hypothetical protein